MWIFGYGSLLYRPSFEFVEQRRAFVRGWARRFWQGSPDHRGRPDAPGRVVTLVPQGDAACGGCAYRIDPHDAEVVLSALDVREQAGFARKIVPLRAAPDAEPFAEALTWIAEETNDHFLGPLSERAIADYVRRRSGPSGSNADYVLRLAQALRALDVADPHVEAIAEHLGPQDVVDGR